MTAEAKRVWIDLDNSPHVPFFRPIITELRERGCTVTLTARDAFQVSDLTRLHRIQCRAIGRHYGKSKVMKVVGLMIRTVQLLPQVIRNRPHLAVSHGSRAQLLAAKLLRIPSLLIADYEHAKHVVRPEWAIVPDVVASSVSGRLAKRILKYPGIKEDVYVSNFRPDPSLLSGLGVDESEILVTLRPPATEAHYHNPESEQLFSEVMDLLVNVSNVRTVLLPRNDRQAALISRRWPDAISSSRIIVPRRAVDGLNLIWNSDLVISGGGTMNREAAALSVPVYSIFRGPIGAVDRYLADTGRLVLIRSIADIHSRIALVKRRRSEDVTASSSAALESIVKSIQSALLSR